MTMAGNATHPLPRLPFLPLELVLGCCGPWGAVPAQMPEQSLKPSTGKDAAINSKESIKEEHPLFFLFPGFAVGLQCGGIGREAIPWAKAQQTCGAPA